MKIKTIGVLLVAGLVVLAAIVVFAGTAAAVDIEEDEDGNAVLENNPEGPADDPIRFKVTILKDDGTPDKQRIFAIQKYSANFSIWWTACVGMTDNDGYALTNYALTRPDGRYRLVLRYGFLDWGVVETRDLTEADFEFDGYGRWNREYWTYRWNYQIPEFATIAIPAVAVLGLFLFYSHRKRKEE